MAILAGLGGILVFVPQIAILFSANQHFGRGGLYVQGGVYVRQNYAAFWHERAEHGVAHQWNGLCRTGHYEQPHHRQLAGAAHHSDGHPVYQLQRTYSGLSGVDRAGGPGRKILGSFWLAVFGFRRHVPLGVVAALASGWAMKHG